MQAGSLGLLELVGRLPGVPQVSPGGRGVGATCSPPPGLASLGSFSLLSGWGRHAKGKEAFKNPEASFTNQSKQRSWRN